MSLLMEKRWPRDASLMRQGFSLGIVSYSPEKVACDVDSVTLQLFHDSLVWLVSMASK